MLLRSTLLSIMMLAPAAWSADATVKKFLPSGGPAPVEHSYYMLAFDGDYGIPAWVVYHNFSQNRVHVVQRGSEVFKPDPLIPASPKSSLYKGGGYDRGHMCPADDMEFSKEALADTFTTANIAPQLPGFNRGIWKELETKIRKWVEEGRNLIVITGPVRYKGGAALKGRVAVPEQFFKIVVDVDRKEAVGFLMSNRSYPREFTPDDLISPIKDIEFRTGLKFKLKVKEVKRFSADLNKDERGFFRYFQIPSNND